MVGRLRTTLAAAITLLAPAALAVLEPRHAAAAIGVAQRVDDINPGAAASAPVWMTPYGRYVVFRGTGTGGDEPWRSDGTPAGTTRIADINPGAFGSSPNSFAVIGGRVVFAAYDPAHGEELWRTNGTAAGTARIDDIYPGVTGSQPRQPLRVGNSILFKAEDGSHGTEPWRTDGTAAGTGMVADINPGAGSGVGFYFPAVSGGFAFFAAGEPAAGNELWRSDATGPGTDLVANIALPGSSSPQEITPAGGWIYFTADDGITGRELWRSDGEPGGTTQLVSNLDGAATDSGVTGLTAFKGHVYFAVDSPGNGVELLRTKTPGPGVELVADINPVGDSNPQSLTVVGNRLFLTAVSGGHGRELWRSDGVPGGVTEMVEEINAGAASSICGIPYLTPLGNELFFCASDGSHGNELWRSDGTAAGTNMVTDVNPGPTSSNPSMLAALGDTLYLNADDGATGSELWAVDTGAPDTNVSDAPAPGAHIADPTPALQLDSSAIDLDRFQCSSGAGWSNCAGRNGKATVGPLPDGPTHLGARAVDVRNNADPTAALVPLFTVDTTPPAIRAKGRKLRLRKRSARLRVRCPASELTGPCKGRVKLKTRKRVRVGGAHRKLTLARGKLELDPGEKGKVKLEFGRRARRALARSPKARKAKLTIKTRDGLANKGRLHKRVKVAVAR